MAEQVGDRAVVLSWHVDYWDRLGWTDPFGSAAASARQTEYAKARSESQRWTPQWRLEGASLRGGRLGDKIQAGLQQAMAKTPPVAITATATWVPAAATAGDTTDPLGTGPAPNDRVEVRVQVTRTRPDTELPKLARVVPVLVLRKAVTPVPRGENSGKTLAESWIAWVPGQPFKANAPDMAGGKLITFDVPKGRKRENLAVALIVEDPERMQPLESRLVDIAAPPADSGSGSGDSGSGR